MEQRQLERSSLRSRPLGLGCMGMPEFYGTPDEREAIRTIHKALELGVTPLDTADMYGMGDEPLLGEALRSRREQAVVTTRLGILRKPNGSWAGYDGRSEYVRQGCEASLRRLGLEGLRTCLPGQLSVSAAGAGSQRGAATTLSPGTRPK